MNNAMHAANATVVSPIESAHGRPAIAATAADQPPAGPVRVIHNNAVTANTANTRISAGRHRPTAGMSMVGKSPMRRVTQNQMIGTITNVTGNPNDIHPTNEYSTS